MRAVCDACWDAVLGMVFPDMKRLTPDEAKGITCALLHIQHADAKLRRLRVAGCAYLVPVETTEAK